LSCSEMVGKAGWNLIIDEVPAVDSAFSANLSITWDDWVSLLDVSPNSECDSVLNVGVKPGCFETAETYAFNEQEDDVIKVTQPLWEKLVNRHWQTVLTRSSWQVAGYDGKAQLQAHSWLKPSILARWARVTIM